MTHVRTSLYYPQSNGKLERWHQTIKSDCIRPGSPLSVEDARRLVAQFVAYYNNERLHSAIGYIRPKDKLAGREAEIFAQRRRQLALARENRRRHWQQQPQQNMVAQGRIIYIPTPTNNNLGVSNLTWPILQFALNQNKITFPLPGPSAWDLQTVTRFQSVYLFMNCEYFDSIFFYVFSQTGSQRLTLRDLRASKTNIN